MKTSYTKQKYMYATCICVRMCLYACTYVFLVRVRSSEARDRTKYRSLRITKQHRPSREVLTSSWRHPEDVPRAKDVRRDILKMYLESLCCLRTNQSREPDHLVGTKRTETEMLIMICQILVRDSRSQIQYYTMSTMISMRVDWKTRTPVLLEEQNT